MWLWRNFLFLVFAAVAAPLEYHVRWCLGIVKYNKPPLEALAEPLIAGALFFYSIIVVVEGLFRIEMYPELATRWESRTLKVSGGFLCVPFFVYILRGVESPLSPDSFRIQLAVALVSLGYALCTHLFISRTHAASATS